MAPYTTYDAFMRSVDADPERHRAAFEAAAPGIDRLPRRDGPAEYQTDALDRFWHDVVAAAVVDALSAWIGSTGNVGAVKRRLTFPGMLADLVERHIRPHDRSVELVRGLDALRSHGEVGDTMARAIALRCHRAWNDQSRGQTRDDSAPTAASR